jgi:hypothetical protein
MPLSDEERETMRRAHKNVPTLSMFDNEEIQRLELMQRDTKTNTPSLFTF